MPLKLYVWRGVFTDYTSGMAFAIATDAEQARDLIYTSCHIGNQPYSPEGANIDGATRAFKRQMTKGVYRYADLAAEPEVYDLTHPVGFAVWGG